jgi:hypothetical protein
VYTIPKLNEFNFELSQIFVMRHLTCICHSSTVTHTFLQPLKSTLSEWCTIFQNWEQLCRTFRASVWAWCRQACKEEALKHCFILGMSHIHIGESTRLFKLALTRMLRHGNACRLMLLTLTNPYIILLSIFYPNPYYVTSFNIRNTTHK